MSAERVPSRSEVIGWSPQQLADYLRRVELLGCDKVVLKNAISGVRFVNLSDNDLQKFPKLHTPMISKISSEIRKKEEKRSLFGKKPTPKYQEPETPAEPQGWGEDEFDDEEFDDDYESPYSGDDEGSVGDYESPNDDDDGNEYEPPPTEPSEEHKLCPTLPIADGGYIDSTHRGRPPVVSPRPPVSPNLSPSQPEESRKEQSPHRGWQPPEKCPPVPPQIFRNNKPGRAPGSTVSPARGPQRSAAERLSTQSWKPTATNPSRSQPVHPPSSSVCRSDSSAKSLASRFDGRMEQTQDEGTKHNTFPLHNKSLAPRPSLPGPPPRHADSLSPGVQSASSLPHKLHLAAPGVRGGGLDRQSFRPSPPPTAAHAKRDLDPRWYVGKVTRGQAEGRLKTLRRDGAYLVRDSTRQLDNQPFTLMVSYQDKVYNIQIRQHNLQFQLGTGLKVHESFRSVADIISHYSKSPLLLIDAKNRGASQQNQCLLSEPAAYCMGGAKWP